jgi:peroxiredoxin
MKKTRVERREILYITIILPSVDGPVCLCEINRLTYFPVDLIF